MEELRKYLGLEDDDWLEKTVEKWNGFGLTEGLIFEDDRVKCALAMEIGANILIKKQTTTHKESVAETLLFPILRKLFTYNGLRNCFKTEDLIEMVKYVIDRIETTYSPKQEEIDKFINDVLEYDTEFCQMFDYNGVILRFRKMYI